MVLDLKIVPVKRVQFFPKVSILILCPSVTTHTNTYTHKHTLCIYCVYAHVCVCRYCCLVSKSCLTMTPWSPPGPLSMAFPRHKYWGGLPFPSPEDLPDPGIEPRSLALAGRFFTAEPPGKPI